MATHQMYNRNPEFAQVALGGTAVATACPPRKFRGGTVLYDSTSGTFYQRTKSGSTPQWSVVGGSGGSLSSKYWVSSSAAGPSLGYSTISSAIAAAIADGHTATDPASVCVMPGVYAESFTVPCGISVFGVGNQKSVASGGVAYASPVVSGDISFSGSLGTIAVSNIYLAGSMYAQSVTPMNTLIALRDVTVSAMSDHAFKFNANGLSVQADRCTFSAPNGAYALRADSNGSGFSIICTDCVLSAQGAGGGIAQMAPSTWRFTRCAMEVVNAVTSVFSAYSAASVVNLKLTDCMISSSDGNAATSTIYQDQGNGSVEIVGKGTSIYGFTSSVALVGGVGTPSVRTRGGPSIGKYLFANRPANISVLDLQPPSCFISDACKIGEGAGSGTGVIAYFDTTANIWRTISQDILPTI